VKSRRGKKEQTLFNRTGKPFAYLMIVVPLATFALQYVYVNYQSILMAFGYGDGKRMSFVYFERLFTELAQPDTVLYGALLNTLKYFSAGLLQLCLSYLIAYFFFKKVYLHRVYKFIFYLPSILSSVVLITMFKNMLNIYGPLWVVLHDVFGIDLPPLLSNPATATPVILFYGLWSGFGVQMIIFTGTMNRIPAEIFEAARLDGVGWVREMARIVLPLTWETFMMYLLFAFTGLFSASGAILYFTGTNPYLRTYTISFYIFIQTREGLFNYASAIGLFFAAVTLPIVIAVRLITRKINRNITY
jgi:ABC-type sugar transport system permease subunit